MSSSQTVIRFVNIAHFIAHYAMLIFATAVIVMVGALERGYSELLPYATPGFVAFGAGSLLTGWLGDTWSRRKMMAIFFVGIGLSMVGTGLVRTPGQLGLGLFLIGLFASIYHPVGTAMLVAAAERLGREIGINGVWGNVGVACAALLTGALMHFLGWRWAFIVPGLLSVVAGLAFILRVREEPRPVSRAAAELPRVGREAMWRVLVALLACIIATSTTFNAITVALPKIFAERLDELTTNTALLSVITALVFLCGAVAQLLVGRTIDRHSLKGVFVPISLVLAPLLYFGADARGWPLVLVAAGITAAMFGQITVNDAMVGKYTSDRWRARAYSVRYFVGFTAAGASVSVVAWLHAAGGFGLLMRALGVLCLLVFVAALAFPSEHRSAPLPRGEADRA